MAKSKLLSQKEIDALMNRETRKAPQVQSEKKKEVTVYDFRHPDRISKEQMRTLRTIHDRFARTFATYLSNTLRTMIDIKVDTIDQVTYSEYSLSVAVPSCLFIANLSALNGSCIMEMPPNLFFFLIDRLLGGTGRAIDAQREVTVIEQKVMEKIINRALQEFEEAWRDVTPVKPKLSAFETNPQFVQIAPASETVIVILFDVIIGERTYALNICIPFIVLESVLNKLNIHSYMALTQKNQTPEIRKDIQKNLHETKVPVRAILGETSITVEEFINLAIGDVLVLDTNINDEVEITISDKTKFWARPGMKSKKVAVQVSSSDSMELDEKQEAFVKEIIETE